MIQLPQYKSAALLEYESNWARSRVEHPKQYHHYRQTGAGHMSDIYAAERMRNEEQPELDHLKNSNGNHAKYARRAPPAMVTLNASPECAECAAPRECNQDILNSSVEDRSNGT